MSKSICPPIINLTFDKESQDAINAINDMNQTFKEGWVAIVIGQLALIFGGLAVKTKGPSNFIEKSFTFKTLSSDISQTSYSIYSVNWEYFFKSLSSLDRYASHQISTIAGLQMIRSKISPKERLFWKSVHYGCKIK